MYLTHWGQVTHICVSKLTITGSDNGLSPERCHTIIWTNAGILLIGPLGTNFSEILIEIQTFSLKKIRLKMLSAKCCSFRLSLNVLRGYRVTSPMISLLLCSGLSSHINYTRLAVICCFLSIISNHLSCVHLYSLAVLSDASLQVLQSNIL